MNRRHFLKSTVIGGAALASATCRGGLAAEAKGKPNFIIIFVDDQGYQDLGCFGSPNIKTPNIDQMARAGMRFTDFYSAASICTPKRNIFLSSRDRSFPFSVRFSGTRDPPATTATRSPKR